MFEEPVRLWAELERQMVGQQPSAVGAGSLGDRGSPRSKDGYSRPDDLRRYCPPMGGGERLRVPYAELHCHSNFSFLDGAAHPEELVEEAARQGLDAIALTDHDGLYGAVRFAEAARSLGVRTVFGAELSLGLSGEQSGVADPVGEHLLVLARGAEGYRRLARVLTGAHLAGTKGRPVYDLDVLGDELAGHVQVLTGCRKGAVARALDEGGYRAARAALDELTERFGRGRVAVELTPRGVAEDDERLDALAALAVEAGLPMVASSEVHYARPSGSRLATALAAVRARRSLDEMDGWLPGAPHAWVRSGAEMSALLERYPGAVPAAAQVALECSFDLDLLAPRLPPYPVPAGHDEDSWLRHVSFLGAAQRYGTLRQAPRAYRQLDYELGIIARLGFAGYFLVVHEIVQFCRAENILCQGRGSAATSAVCFALSITNCDPIRWKLLFERFLSPERDGPPDIDLDIESGRREEVIQHVYARYGRRNAALVANVISYRPRLAVRDMARALGYSTGQIDAWRKTIDPHQLPSDATTSPVTGRVPGPAAAPTAPTGAAAVGGGGGRASAGSEGAGTEVAETEVAEGVNDRGEDQLPELVAELARQVAGYPRHLGIHPGGMVITDQPVGEIVPIEWARMQDRTVLQWDKDDCASAGLVKFDLLGLGMLSAIHNTLDLIHAHHQINVDIAQLDLEDTAVWDMLCNADSVGVFQVESRAQMATLPRLRPRDFWSLAVEVALIRPGPIQGGSVHPYIRRRDGEPWAHDHPLMANALDRTLGVPLFQEQVMQLAIDVADFTPGEADSLRRAMSSKRSQRRMRELQERFHQGAAKNGITGALAESIYTRIEAFSGYGFPLSHALSFAHLVFVSAHLKCHYPAAFCAGLLQAQPMGFYSPQTLIADARRHGVSTHRADIHYSAAQASLETDPRSHQHTAIRLGLDAVRTISTDTAHTIATERDQHGPYLDPADLAARTCLSSSQLEALATAGALAPLAQSRQAAIWEAGASTTRPGQIPGLTVATPPPALPTMSAWELIAADIWATGISTDQHPVQLLRAHLGTRGILTAAAVRTMPHHTRIHIAGAVTHRQRPATAGGITFLNLEDETGMTNIILTPGLLRRTRTTVRTSPGLIIRGLVERQGQVVNVLADHLTPLELGVHHESRDYR